MTERQARAYAYGHDDRVNGREESPFRRGAMFASLAEQQDWERHYLAGFYDGFPSESDTLAE